MLQNAAKRGKLLESYKNFGGIGFGAVREAFPKEGAEEDFFRLRGVLQKYPDARKKDRNSRFSA
jgi:hypothetical protein